MLRNSISVAALLLLTGCNGQQQIIGGTPPPKVYKSVISLSPSTTELLGVTGQERFILVGRTSSCDYPPGVKSVPVVAETKPDFEKIAQLKPDLILYDADLYNDNDVAKINQLGIDTFVLDATTLEKFGHEAATLGSLVGGETGISDYTDRIVRSQEAAETAAGKTQITVALISPDKGGEHLIAGTKSFQAAELRASDVVPVGPEADKFVTLSPENLIKDDPDYIITAGSPDPFLKDSRFANLKAIKNHHIFGLLEDIAVRRGGRVDQFIQAVYKTIRGGLHE